MIYKIRRLNRIWVIYSIDETHNNYLKIAIKTKIGIQILSQYFKVC